MKKFHSIFSFIMVICLLLTVDLDARGGRGRGRPSPSRSVNRSPSMSRTTRTPPKSTPRAKPATRSKKRPKDTQTRNQVQQFLKDRPSTRPEQRPATRPGERPVQRPQDRPITRPSERPGQKPGERPSRQGDRVSRQRQETGNKIRNQIDKHRPDSGDWFNDNFWNQYGHRPPYRGRHPRNYWWRWGTVGGIGSWLGWYGNPLYYGYDDDGYWGSSDYSEQLEEIDAAADQSTSGDWKPLGVFALSKDKGKVVTPNIFVQLALNKEGLISGSYYNASMFQAHEVEGMVDEESQRAAWKVVDNEMAPIIETGIYNLTENEVPVRIYFSDGRVQEAMLIRLEEPESQ